MGGVPSPREHASRFLDSLTGRLSLVLPLYSGLFRLLASSLEPKGISEVRSEVETAMQALGQTQEVISRLGARLANQKAELETALKEYERLRNLAALEGAKAQPLLDELRRRDRLAVIWSAVISLVMIGVGLVLSHFLRLWFPGFEF